MFTPSIATLTHVINNGFLGGFPFMKSKLVPKYLAKSPAMSKGRMKRPCTGIRSTRSKDIDMVIYHILTKANPNPSVEPQQMIAEGANVIHQYISDTVNNIFCFVALAEKSKVDTIHRCNGSPASDIVGWATIFLCCVRL